MKSNKIVLITAMMMAGPALQARADGFAPWAQRATAAPHATTITAQPPQATAHGFSPWQATSSTDTFAAIIAETSLVTRVGFSPWQAAKG